MRKNFGAKTWVYPMPVFIIGTYGEDGTANAMNAAWAGVYDTNQVMLCDGGFGASPRSRGSACYCVNLYTGKTSRFERRDILGILKEDQIPKWAQHELQAQRQKKREPKARGAVRS